jgi:hypothetical protein
VPGVDVDDGENAGTPLSHPNRPTSPARNIIGHISGCFQSMPSGEIKSAVLMEAL